MNTDKYKDKIAEAIKNFWRIREEKSTQSGKTLDSFINILECVVRDNGLPDAEVLKGNKAVVPGYYRPRKGWDFVVINEGKLIAIIELKSIASSFGNNTNNRCEEAIGSSYDLQKALNEKVIPYEVKVFKGYLILIEDCPSTNRDVNIHNMRYFKPMSDFLIEPEKLDEIYIKNKNGEYPYQVPGISYIQRLNFMCNRFMHESIYSAASIITSPRAAIDTGEYGEVETITGLNRFLFLFTNHIIDASLHNNTKSNTSKN
jgi:hypothetical protein